MSEVEGLDPVFPNAVRAMLDRFDRAKGKGGYPTANEREAMRRCLSAIEGGGAKVVTAAIIEDALRHRLSAKDGRVTGFADAADDVLSIIRAAANPPATPIAGGFGSRPQEAVVPTEPVADRWADLERLAKALQVSRDAFMMLSPEERMTGRPDWWVDYRAFSDAANPAAILELIAAARRDDGAGQ